MSAFGYDQTDVVRSLLQYGVDLQIHQNELMEHSIQFGFLHRVQFLVEQGVPAELGLDVLQRGVINPNPGIETFLRDSLDKRLSSEKSALRGEATLLLGDHALRCRM